MEVSGQLHAPVALPPPGKELLVLIEQENEWSRDGLGGEFLPLSEIEPQSTNLQPVTLPNELSQLIKYKWNVYEFNYGPTIRALSSLFLKVSHYRIL
jgi:hypothetical protein